MFAWDLVREHCINIKPRLEGFLKGLVARVCLNYRMVPFGFGAASQFVKHANEQHGHPRLSDRLLYHDCNNQDVTIWPHITEIGPDERRKWVKFRRRARCSAATGLAQIPDASGHEARLRVPTL